MVKFHLAYTLIFYLVEVIGYLGRILAYDATGQLPPYLLQSLFLLLAPVLFAASLYMTLGRIILAVDGTRYSVIPPRWLTRLFVATDVISFMIQSGGAGMLSSGSASQSKVDLGQNIIVAGLIFQLVAFSCFILTSVIFHLRARKDAATSMKISWKGLIIALYLTSALIMIRNIFRAIQYSMGEDGYLLTHEWTIYVMDGLLMVFVTVVYAWKYPSRLHATKTINYDTELGTIPEAEREDGQVAKEPETRLGF